jgi:micrococcal nuclease
MYHYPAIVVDIHDADTMRVNVDLGFSLTLRELPLRLHGINAPELSTEAGKAARDWLHARLPIGSPVMVRTLKDKREKYGRYLAIVFDCDDAIINQELIKAGHAVEWDGTGPRP